MTDGYAPHTLSRRAHAGGLVLAALTALAAWTVWVEMPGWIGRLGYGDLLVLARLAGLAAVFALATVLEGLLARIGSEKS